MSTILRSIMRYPDAFDPKKVGSYPASTNSGGGYFYDEILEYRVWVKPPKGDDLCYAFPAYKQASKFSKVTANAQKPVVLVLQQEHINEPHPGEYVHIKVPRVTEWQVEWLRGTKGTKQLIAKFLKAHKQ